MSNKQTNPTEKIPTPLTEIIGAVVKADDNGKDTAKLYQQTSFAKAMDDNNKEALQVAAEKGFDEAAKHMMKSAGNDYSRMRSMYG